MSDVERLIAQYIAEHRSGGTADPRAYVSRASPADRVEVAVLIDGYLARAPRPTVDPDSMRGTPAERTVDELGRALGGVSGLWPALLPRLRDRAGLRRGELVERLADALGLGSKEAKVGTYYAQMEQGLLPSWGVSSRVLEALGQLLGETAQALRSAGRSVGGPEPPVAATAAPRARTALSKRATAAPAAPAMESYGAPAWDDVDQLFRGGGTE